MARKQWTLGRFTKWLHSFAGPHIQIDGPFEIVACARRDVNCHGWRLVKRKGRV